MDVFVNNKEQYEEVLFLLQSAINAITAEIAKPEPKKRITIAVDSVTLTKRREESKKRQKEVEKSVAKVIEQPVSAPVEAPVELDQKKLERLQKKLAEREAKKSQAK